MEAMDWGDAVDFVSFGNVGASQVDEASFYILIAPQNVVGNTIMTPLLEMVSVRRGNSSCSCSSASAIGGPAALRNAITSTLVATEHASWRF